MEVQKRARRQPLSAAGLSCVLALVAAACGSGSHSPTTPTPPTPTPPTSPTPTPAPPPAQPNNPPVIQSMAVSSPRVETDGSIQVAATVTDDDTPVDQLVYQWSASPAGGAFSGTGARVTWTAPHGQPTPDVYTIALSVIENYVQDGKPAQHTVSSSAQVHYNDSNAEVGSLSEQFLKDFSTFTVSPAQCVRNFSDSCPGKAEELSQIKDNRKLFHILRGDYSIQSITFNGSRTSANVIAPCTFYDIPNDTGREERVAGICTLIATYEGWRWYLCDSHFKGTGTTPLGIMGAALSHRSTP